MEDRRWTMDQQDSSHDNTNDTKCGIRNTKYEILDTGPDSGGVIIFSKPEPWKSQLLDWEVL